MFAGGFQFNGSPVVQDNSHCQRSKQYSLFQTFQNVNSTYATYVYPYTVNELVHLPSENSHTFVTRTCLFKYIESLLNQELYEDLDFNLPVRRSSIPYKQRSTDKFTQWSYKIYVALSVASVHGILGHNLAPRNTYSQWIIDLLSDKQKTT